MFGSLAGSLSNTKSQASGGTSVAGFSFDATLSERSSRKYNKTKYPTETGFQISDHISRMPPELSIEGKFTSMTMGAANAAASAYFSGGAGELMSGRWLGNAVGGKAKLTQAKKALEAIADAGNPVTVVSGIDVYERYVIESIEFSRNSNSEEMSVSIQLSRDDQVQAVWADLTRRSTVQRVSRKGGRTKKSAGSAKTEAKKETQESNKTVVVGLRDILTWGANTAMTRIGEMVGVRGGK